MAEAEKLFTDGDAYDRSMGHCSRIAGAAFLDWLSLDGGLAWLDVGCGTGSFTELILERCAPVAVTAVDPLDVQIGFARERPWAGRVDFRVGDAMALPFGDDVFDVAVMALVIQYIPDPAEAMAEMVRVVRPGGTVAAYTWPGSREQHPMQPLSETMAAVGITRAERPGNAVRQLDTLTALFSAAGLRDVQGHPYEILMQFDDFESYWSSQTALAVREMSDEEVKRLKPALRERLPADAEGRISYTACVNAVRGRLPD